jgi:hypothetical protein
MQARIKRESVNGSMQQKHTANLRMQDLQTHIGDNYSTIHGGWNFLVCKPSRACSRTGDPSFFQPDPNVGRICSNSLYPLPLIEVTPFIHAGSTSQKDPSLEEAQKEVSYPLMQLSFLHKGTISNLPRLMGSVSPFPIKMTPLVYRYGLKITFA